jgi:hypothetical protein
MPLQDFRPVPEAVFEGFSVWVTATSIMSLTNPALLAKPLVSNTPHAVQLSL